MSYSGTRHGSRELCGDALPQVTVDEAPYSPPATTTTQNNYKGFAGGVVSGAAKLAVGHPFDTVKVRLQVAANGQFNGALDCLAKTVRSEGLQGLYKGVTPPMLGWIVSDSIMLGSLTFYRKILLEHGFHRKSLLRTDTLSPAQVSERLPTLGHAVAGCLAGWTVSLIACPVEQVKGRLQIQYAADKSQRFYSGPIDCAWRIARSHGIAGMYHGLASSVAFRSFFLFWWGSYDLITKTLKKQSSLSLSNPAINFWAGGLSAQIFWLTAYPFDVIKQRIMTDPLGGALRDGQPRYGDMRSAARGIYLQAGYRGFWRGFAPCFLRAFPANGVALVAFEAVMRSMNNDEQGSRLAMA